MAKPCQAHVRGWDGSAGGRGGRGVGMGPRSRREARTGEPQGRAGQSNGGRPLLKSHSRSAPTQPDNPGEYSTQGAQGSDTQDFNTTRNEKNSPLFRHWSTHRLPLARKPMKLTNKQSQGVPTGLGSPIGHSCLGQLAA